MLARLAFFGVVSLVLPAVAQARKPDRPDRPDRLEIRAEAAVIVDYDTGKELFTKNPDEVRPIASVGKLFLALTVRARSLPLDGSTTITEEDRRIASGGAPSRLAVGKTFSNHDLLRAMLVASDNRACSALGRAAGLAPVDLVAAMNEQAQKLGLVRTHFVDPTGLKNNVSTPREIAAVLKAALADPVIAEILATPHVTIRSLEAKKALTIEYNSTDLALRSDSKKFPVLGGKTGYTDDARYCLAIAAQPGEHRVGMVFLGEDGKLTRFGDFHRAVAWIQSGGPERAQARAVPVGAAVEPPPAAVTPRIRTAR